MAKNLQMIFATATGTKTSMTLGDVKQNLAEENVRSAMEAMLGSSVFATSKAEAYATAVSASYVETTETEIFNDAAPAA